MNTSKNKLTFAFAGDICVHQKINADFCSDRLSNFIKKHDYRLATWEAPIINSECESNVKMGPHIYQDESYKYLISRKLFNVFSLANNHITDFGTKGLKNTITSLSDYHLLGAGLDYESIYQTLILDKNNVKIGFVAAGEAQFGCVKENYNVVGGYAWIFSDLIIKNIVELRSKVDFIVIVPHAGLEMESLPLPEWRNLYKKFIDYGADLVVASHAHVIQPKEQYKGKSIYYCLGNFFFNTNSNNKNWFNSLILSCEFVKSENRNYITINELFTNSENSYLDFAKPEISAKFEELNEIIKNEETYMPMIENICVSAWQNYYKSYYRYSLKNRIINKLPKLVKRIFSFILGKAIPDYNHEVVLYHNISIETHRFTVERAIKKINSIY